MALNMNKRSLRRSVTNSLRWKEMRNILKKYWISCCRSLPFRSRRIMIT